MKVETQPKQSKQTASSGLFGSLPAPSTGQKRERAPKQIKSDSIKRSKQSGDDDVSALVGESSKKTQPSASSSSSGGLSGLLGMLPAPKKAQQQQKKSQDKPVEEADDVPVIAPARSNTKRSAPVDIFSLGSECSMFYVSTLTRPYSIYKQATALAKTFSKCAYQDKRCARLARLRAS